LAALLGAVVHLNVLPNDFTYDDHFVVRTNPLVAQSGHLRAIWTTDMWSTVSYAGPNRDLLYRPATITSYRMIYALFGACTWPQLAVNVLLHALICALVVRLAMHFGLDGVAALMAGLLFAVLPIHSEVLAGVVGRADLLSCAILLSAVVAHRRAILHPLPSRASFLWIAMSAIASFLALCSKENAMAVVPVVFVVEWYWTRRRDVSRDDKRGAVEHVAYTDGETNPPQSPHGKGGGHNRPTTGTVTASMGRVARLTPLVLAAVAYLALRYNALGGRLHQDVPISKTVNILVDAPAWQHVLGVIQLWGMYWAKTFWPAVLSIKYSINSIQPPASVLNGHVIIGILAASLLLVASVMAWRRGRRETAILCTLLVLCYAPTSNAVVLMQVFFAERIWYLPSVWVCLLIGLMLKPLMRNKAVAAAFAMIILAMIARTWSRCGEWRNNGTLFAAAYRDQPDGVGPLQLYGDWLAQHNEPERGIELLRRAITIDPGFTDARFSLGRALLQWGSPKAAIAELQLALMQDPNNPLVQNALAQAQTLGDAGASISMQRAQEAAQSNPDDVEAHLVLVEEWRDIGHLDRALEHVRTHDAKFSQNARWQATYAVTLAIAGRRDEAIDRYRRSVELSPGTEQTRIELGMTLLERRSAADIAEARRSM